ncbi:hypothetical protein [Polyangium mundeleinium]|uniref:Uncharacterized protein n=1 Tax=Polyangium mundeleinium TaxID=2995306 RepID=A0ABT5EVU7_9BACT|nr:hypothetical protein [Polyangium mundeleinium]MDC0744925.1 hypothetical protein [Polyangium mundeleinium]
MVRVLLSVYSTTLKEGMYDAGLPAYAPFTSTRKEWRGSSHLGIKLCGDSFDQKRA